MRQINDEDAYELLHGEGFSVLQISRLIPQRSNYKVSALDQIDPKDTPHSSPSEKASVLKTLVAALSLKSNKHV